MSGNIIEQANIIEVRQGDSFDIFIHLIKDNKSINLSESTISLTVYNNIGNSIVLQRDSVGVDMENGKVCIEIYPSDTEKMLAGDYPCTIRALLENGRVHTFFPSGVSRKGTFRVIAK